MIGFRVLYVKAWLFPESRFRKLSLRAQRSNLIHGRKIAAYPSGARNDAQTKGLLFLSPFLGVSIMRTDGFEKLLSELNFVLASKGYIA